MGRRAKDLWDDSEFDYLIDLELDSVCECGHRNLEHSISGQCHGCQSCDDQAARDDVTESHPYARCGCTQFQLTIEAGAEATATLAR